MTGRDELIALADEVRARAPAFWSRVKQGAPEECWPWTGTRAGRSAYGKFYIGKTAYVRAHRAAVIISGRSIPDGMVVCHACDNRSCCNPGHLFVGTLADNNRDMTAKGRGVVPRPHGERHGSAKLSTDQARAIRADRRKVSVVAREYGVSVNTIARIRNGETWAVALATLPADPPQADDVQRGEA